MAKVAQIECVVSPDYDADTSYLDQDGFEARKAAFERGDFGHCGIYALARVEYEGEHDAKGSFERILTPGLWGIEDDSGQEHFDEVYRQELVTLRAMLDELGVRYREDQFEEENEVGALT